MPPMALAKGVCTRLKKILDIHFCLLWSKAAYRNAWASRGQKQGWCLSLVHNIFACFERMLFLNDITKLLACFPFERYCGAAVLKQSLWLAAKPLNHLHTFKIKAVLQEPHQLSRLSPTARSDVCLHSNNAQRKKVEKLHRENQLVHNAREILIATNSNRIFTDFRKITVLQ